MKPKGLVSQSSLRNPPSGIGMNKKKVQNADNCISRYNIMLQVLVYGTAALWSVGNFLGIVVMNANEVDREIHQLLLFSSFLCLFQFTTLVTKGLLVNCY